MRGAYYSGALLLAALAVQGALHAGDDTGEGRIPLETRAYDPDGGELKFFWRQVDGTPVKIDNPRAAEFDPATKRWISKTFFIAKEAGTYSFEVTVSNEYGQDNKRLYVREVKQATPPPEAIPGPDQKHKVGEKVVMNGSDSKASDNKPIVEFKWTIKQAPQGFTLPPQLLSLRQFDFVPRAPGLYSFELTVNDGKSWSAAKEIQINISPREGPRFAQEGDNPGVIELPPNVNVQPKVVIRPRVQPGGNAKVGDTIVLDGKDSVADKKLSPKFFWVQKDNGKDPLARPLSPDRKQPFDEERTDPQNYPVWTFMAKEAGRYTFTLRIVAGETVEESEPVTFNVIGDAPPPDVKLPVAVVKASSASAAVGDEIKLDASDSYSPDGRKLQFMWKPVPGKSFPELRGQDGPTVRATAQSEGEFWIAVVVNDGVNSVTSDSVILKFTASNRPPVIEGRRSYTCLVDEWVPMEVSVTDPDGDPFEITWTVEDPPIAVPSAVAHQNRFQFRPQKAGMFLLKVTAKDNKGASSSMNIQVGAKDGGALAPTAEISGVAVANVGDTVTVAATKSTSPNKTQLIYRWSDVSAGGVKIEDPPPGNATKWTFKITAPGRYSVQLIVNDGHSDSDPAKWNIDVPLPREAPPVAAKPVAHIEGPLKPVDLHTEVELLGDGSTGTGLRYKWSQGPDGGPKLQIGSVQANLPNLRFTPEDPGTYTLTLIVTDRAGVSSDPAQFTVAVKSGSGPGPVVVPSAKGPIAVANVVGKNPTVGKMVSLSAEGSTDASGAKLKYKWRKVNGPAIEIARDDLPELSLMPATAGTYDFELVVSNGTTDSAPVTVSFTVAAAAVGPKAVIAPITNATAGESVTLDGRGSASTNGANLEYRWRQLDGEPVRLNVGDDRKDKFDVLIPSEGKYTFELMVNDGNAWSDPAKLVFTAKPRGKNTLPIVVIDKLSISVEVGGDAVIDASKSNDPDKGPKPLSFHWRLKGGKELQEDGPILHVSTKAAGKFIYEVQADDGKDMSEPAVVEVNVVDKGVAPVAIATVTPNPVKKSVRGNPNNPIIVLDGANNRGEDEIKKRSFMWKQVGGEDLKLAPEQLQKAQVGLRIYKPGIYKFQLIESDGDLSSKPVEVELKVTDE